MNKREISEIKKQFKKDNNAITRICGCYVDAEKQIKTTLKEAFFALSEEEIFKYYEIFKKSLSGGIGKNLHNLEYSIHDEGPDSAHELLMKLRDEKLAAGAFVDDRGSAGGRHGCRSVVAGNHGHVGEFCVAGGWNDDLAILFVAVSWRKKASEGTAV